MYSTRCFLSYRCLIFACCLNIVRFQSNVSAQTNERQCSGISGQQPRTTLTHIYLSGEKDRKNERIKIANKTKRE